MRDQDFTASILVDKSKEDSFEAIVDPRSWWGKEIEGRTDRLGDEWTYRYGDMHFCKIRTVELEPGRRVVWHVVEASLNVLDDKTEWTGTDLVFDIAEKNDRTEIRFTHRGLKPGAECYGMCSSAWTSLIGDSLRNLVVTGQGRSSEAE